MSRKLILLLMLMFCVVGAFAQESTEVPTPTEEPTPLPVLTVTSAEPSQHTAGTIGTLSITGANFTSNTIVRLLEFGYLETNFINATALTAILPPALTARVYDIEVSDLTHGSITLTQRLRVLSPALPPEPAATPIVIPLGQPMLVVRNYSLAPNIATVGGSVRVSFEVVNQGNAPAFGVSVAVESGAFVPSGGQASVTLPDLFPNGATTSSITVNVSPTATAGANTIPLVFNYRDSEGKTYSSKGAIGIEVSTTLEMPQVTLLTYITTPQIADAGQLVVISAQFRNSGNKIANQVLLRMTGDGRTLLAGPRGDTFPIGDIVPNGVVNVELPMIVSSEAKSGPQPQAFVLTYMVEDKPIEVTSSLTVQVAASVKTRPLILLESVSYGGDNVAPGNRFILDFALKNVGDAPADEMLVTFGTVEVTPPSGGSGGGGTESGGSTTRQTTNGFAPIGSGGATFRDELLQGEALSLSQEFIANATLTSGIYNLPITVQHRQADGTTATDTFYASIVVVAPPRLQERLDAPPPEFANAFEPFSLGLTFINQGKNTVNFKGYRITGENIEVLDGLDSPMSPLKTEEETSVNGLVMPTGEGEWRMVLTVDYEDELNQPQTLVYEYVGQAMIVEQPPFIEEPQLPEEPTSTPLPSTQEVIGRLLLGFFGLGE